MKVNNRPRKKRKKGEREKKKKGGKLTGEQVYHNDNDGNANDDDGDGDDALCWYQSRVGETKPTMTTTTTTVTASSISLLIHIEGDVVGVEANSTPSGSLVRSYKGAQP